MKFREDINALRAVAVAAVIIFHFNPSWLPGGFVGVDVFFVISGYLMTGIIISRLQCGEFSLRSFYLARGRRIIPALAAMCLFLLVFGYLIIIPKDLELLSKHVLSSLAFISNIVYAGENNYFDVGASEKWLLHTWSLSVEWQFYLIYPILLAVASRLVGIGSIRILVLGAAIIGYVYCIYATELNPTSAFYLLPARAWEMFVGGVAYLYPLKIRDAGKRVIELLGWAIILLSCFVLHESSAWPGSLAIIPVFGAYLVIQSNVESSFVSASAFIQNIGTYSYSLYLWHWPIIVAVGYLQIEKNLSAMLVVLVMLAFCSYHLTERRRIGFRGLSLFFIGVLVASAAVLNSSGLELRVSPDFQLSEKEYHREYYGGAGYPANKIFYFGSKKESIDGVLVGDSFGLQYAKSYSSIAKERSLYFSALFDHGCLILPNLTRYLNGAEDYECSKEYNKIQNELKHNPNAPLVLAYSWGEYISSSGYKGAGRISNFESAEKYYRLLRVELEQLFRESGAGRSYFLVGVPQKAQIFAFRCLARTELLGARVLQGCEDHEPYRESDINKELALIADYHDNVFYIDPNEILCSSGRCITISERKPIHSDRKGHLSVYGAELVAPFIVDYFVNQAGLVIRDGDFSQNIQVVRRTDDSKVALDRVRVDVHPAFRFTYSIMEPGVLQHLDRTYTYDFVPAKLLNGILFQGIHRPPTGTIVKFKLEAPAKVYFFFHSDVDGGYGEIFAKLKGWERSVESPKYDIYNGDHGHDMVMYEASLDVGTYSIPPTTKDKACFSIVFQ